MQMKAFWLRFRGACKSGLENEGDLQTQVVWVLSDLVQSSNVCSWPILLKNSISTDNEKFLAFIGRDARFELGGYNEKLMSRRRAF